MKNGLEESYVIKENKKLRCGYTTGSCAAAAAQAAARMLFTGQPVEEVRLTTPKGIVLFLEPTDVRWDGGSVICAIRKDAGDDPDVTDGLSIYVRVRLCEREACVTAMKKFGWNAETADAVRVDRPAQPVFLEQMRFEENGRKTADDRAEACMCRRAEAYMDSRAEAYMDSRAEASTESRAEACTDGKVESSEDIGEEACADSREKLPPAAVSILGGEGVGIVTLPGLGQPVGAPAINRVPRNMIRSEVQKVCREFRYSGGIEVTISAPEGKKVAERTFNPRLGIRDGISILGTSGIVEPMSEQALLSTIELEMRQKAVSQRYLLVTPGNYGAEYLKGHFPFKADQAVKCSNYVGRTIDIAVSLELSGLLFVAHIGKFIKVAGGIMNTHSGEADARMEILAACALRAGIDADGARRILDAATTDEGLRIIREAGLWKPVTDFILEKINVHLNRRAQNRMRIGAVVFSGVYGELGRTEAAGELVEHLLEY